MRHQAVKVRLYPTTEQQVILAQHFGCSRWWWNHALNLCIETYQLTGKGLKQSALNAFLPKLKKQEGTEWLSECYSQVLQATTLNLVTAYRNFFEGRARYPRLVARVHERVSNVRQDYLHKLSRKLVDENQVKALRAGFANVVENLNTKGMVRNHKLAASISDVGWGMFVNFLSYKLEFEGKVLVEIDRWFPSSKLCSNCHYQVKEMPLEVRAWTCPSCGTHHDRDGNASANIRAEGIRILSVSGTGTAADGGEVRPKLGRKSKLRHSPMKSEAQASTK